MDIALTTSTSLGFADAMKAIADEAGNRLGKALAQLPAAVS